MGPGGDHYERVVLSRAGATPTGANKVGSTLIARVLKSKKKLCGKHVQGRIRTFDDEMTFLSASHDSGQEDENSTYLRLIKRFDE